MAESRALFALAAWKRDCRQFVAQRAAYRCECCGKYCPLNRSGQCDHIIPRRDLAALGINPFDVSNLQHLCASCHSKKTNREARWAGHEKTPKIDWWKKRTKVPGRGRFLEMAGIPPPEPSPVKA